MSVPLSTGAEYQYVYVLVQLGLCIAVWPMQGPMERA